MPTCRLAPILALLVAGCSGARDDGVVDIAFIATPNELYAEGLRLAEPAQHLRGAQVQGLVALDAAGQIVPALAETWIVTDDGQSYIFRIREYDLPGGKRLTAQVARDALAAARRRLAGTSLALDLAKIDDIRAMTGRVIEIRLKSPMPGLLQILAQPELGVPVAGDGLGPMVATRDKGSALLDALPPEARGLPRQPEWEEAVRRVRVVPSGAQAAVDGFSEGEYDLVLGGRIATLPLAGSGALTRGTVRLDAPIGLLGLDVKRTSGVLATAALREAVAMAIDRAALIEPFNIGGWVATTRIVAPGLERDNGSIGERWAGQTIEQRRATAAARVAGLRAAGTRPSLAIALPEGPGSDLMFIRLARDLATIGISTRRVEEGDKPDLVLRDRVARFASARWFLNQFACSVARSQCVPEADALVVEAVRSIDPAERARLLAEAEAQLVAANLYIPLGAPIRWSQVRAGTPGFSENGWAIHPLFPLSRAPI